MNGLYSLGANQLGRGWAAKGHDQQEDISHSPFNFHMPPRLSAVSTIQLEDMFEKPNLESPGSFILIVTRNNGSELKTSASTKK